MWQPIETAPKDNKRPLWLARFNDDGTMQSFDYNGSWESESESWEMPQVYYYWASESGNVEEPSHWAYQPEEFCVLGAQPAPSALAEAIIADMQAQHNSELITENDSGEALIRLDGAIAAVEDNFALAQPAPSIPEGWLRAIDEALVVAHIGVANESDTYEQAKVKLDNLISLHIDEATDPAVNGGWKLVPIEPTETLYQCFSAYDGTSYSNPFDYDDFVKDWREALEAAPEAKP